MKLLSNRAGDFLTGTEIADAVLQYDLALARARTVDLVDIPVVSDAGGRAQFLVGWLTDTASTAADDLGEELVDPGTVIDLYHQAARIGVVRALPFTPEEAADATQAVQFLDTFDT